MTWSHIKILLPIKDENKRNYYINLCITEQLSKRELIDRIKSNSYERLLVKPKHIDIINKENDNSVYDIKEHIKNPIVININKEEIPNNEHYLQLLLLSKLKNFFEELGHGFTFVSNEYKIKEGNKTYYIDLLLFNVEINSYIVVELKNRELELKDKSQTEHYMSLVDNTLKRSFHNKTKGIIISKHMDSYIFNFINSEDITTTTYLLNEFVNIK